MSVVGGPRHAFGDQYRAMDLVVPGAGKVELVYTPEGGGPPEHHVIHDFDAAGVVMGMYNTEASIRGFAKACFEYALDRQWCGLLPEHIATVSHDTDTHTQKERCHDMPHVAPGHDTDTGKERCLDMLHTPFM